MQQPTMAVYFAPPTFSAMLSDEALMAQVAEGQTEAVSQLYDRYASAVMGLSVKMLNDPAAAEEIVQETFWRVWHNATSFRAEQSSFSAWMFRIARNLCIDRWRHVKARPEAALDLHDSYAGQMLANPNAPAVDEVAWVSERRQRVKAALSELPQPQRTVIELAFFWGLSRQQIAEVLYIPLGTVHTRARLAMDKLRIALQAEDLLDG